MFLVPGWPPERHPNGIVTYASAIMEGLRESGAEPMAITTAFEDSGTDASCLAVHQQEDTLFDRVCRRLAPDYHRQYAFGRTIAPVLNERAREGRLDILESHDGFGLARALLKNSPAPVVVRLHGPWFLNGRALGVAEDALFRRRDRMEGRLIREAHAITSPSHDVLRGCREHFGLPIEDAMVIPNPVPPAPADHIWQPKDAEPGTVLFIGRFDRHKGGDLVIDALSHLKEHVPEARLSFAGPDRGLRTGDGANVGLEDYAARILGEHAHPPHFSWLGAVPHGELPQLRKQAAVTVVASRYENFPMALLEAMAQGCPVVAAGAGGIPEIIQDGRNGLLCAPEDPPDLAEKVRHLLQDPALAARLGAQALKDCQERYHPGVVARQMLAFYEDVIGRWRGRGRRG